MIRLILSLILLAPVFWGVTSCETSIEDICDETTMSEVNVSFRVIVNADYTDGYPVEGNIASVSIYKIPCGENAKGRFDFSGAFITGHYETSVVNYNIHNKEDAIVATVKITDSSNNILLSKQVNGEDLQYSGGQTRLIQFDIEDVAH